MQLSVVNAETCNWSKCYYYHLPAKDPILSHPFCFLCPLQTLYIKHTNQKIQIRIYIRERTCAVCLSRVELVQTLIYIFSLIPISCKFPLFFANEWNPLCIWTTSSFFINLQLGWFYFLPIVNRALMLMDVPVPLRLGIIWGDLF